VAQARRALDAGQRADAADADGQTALHLAADRGHCPVLALLLVAQARPERSAPQRPAPERSAPECFVPNALPPGDQTLRGRVCEQDSARLFSHSPARAATSATPGRLLLRGLG
jgi:ankyrin repeat protein